MTALVSLPYAELHAHDRASPAWRFDVAGALVETAANLPRLDYDLATLGFRGLLVEPASTNRNTNSRGEGAVPGVLGSGGALPTGWAGFTGSLTGDVTVIGLQQRRGIDGLVIRIAGTPTNTSGFAARLGGVSETVAVGTVVANRIFVELLAGSLANVASWALRSGAEGSGQTIFAPGAFAEIKNVKEIALDQSSTTLRCTFTNTTAPVDFTIWIGWPTREHGPVTSPILPPVGAPGISVRLADRISRTLNHRFSRSAFTLLARGLFAQASPAGTTRGVLQLDDGTDANRIRVENTPAGSALQMVVTVGGADVATLPLGSMTPGTPFSVAMACADGDIAVVRGGGAVVAAASVVPPGLAFMRVGATGFDHASPMGGWFRAHRLIRGRVDNAALLALAA